MATFSTIWNKTLNDAQWNQALHDFSYLTRNKTYRLGNQTQMTSYWNKMFDYLITHKWVGVKINNIYDYVLKGLKNYSLGTPADMAMAFNENLKSMKEHNWHTTNLISKTNTGLREKAEKIFTKFGHGIKISVDEDFNNENELTRIVVCRSKYGNGPILKYTISGSLTNEKANQIRAAYHYDSGINYFEARPVLLTSWIGFDDTRKQQTCSSQWDDSDLEEIW